MKLYYFPLAPSPRKVGIVVSEKGLDIPTVIVNLREGEHLKESFLSTNAGMTLPVLELDDGTCITESLAISHYLEQLHPEPNLMGVDAKEQALVLMWNDIATLEGYLGIQEAFRNSPDFAQRRALPGPVAYERIPALVERGQQRIQAFFDKLDRRLSDSAYLACDRYTYADIAGYVYTGFAKRVTGQDPSETREHVRRWAQEIAGRPAVAAISS